MISIVDNHPDIENFIKIKSDISKINKANISIRVSDKFMQAVIDDKDFELYFRCDETNEETRKIIKAKDLFRKICENNWNYAEPGLLFWDTIEKWNLLSEDDNFKYAGTNPCAEEPLPAGGSCLLGSINLSEHIKNKRFDLLKFKETVKQAVIALNEVLEETTPLHPLEQQRQVARDWKQIGLGIMGLSDMFIKMEYTYGEKDSIELSKIIVDTMVNTALETSAELAKKYGTYPKYNKKSIFSSNYLIEVANQHVLDLISQHGLRNSQILTIAPTGSLSSMLNISGGIEPLYALSYTRKTESLDNKDSYYDVFPKIVEDYMKKNNIQDEKKLPDWFIVSSQIKYKNRINMQAIWQKKIDASISSTINLPESTSVEDIRNLYIYAWRKKLKGITIMRDNCARIGILTTKNNKNSTQIQKLGRGDIIRSSDDLIGKKRKIITGCGSMHIKAFCDEVDGDLLELFLSKGSSGGCQAFYIGLSRILSLALRSGTNLNEIIDQLKSVPACPSYIIRNKMKGDTSPGINCPNAIGIQLAEIQKQIFEELNVGDEDEILEDKIVNNSAICPECEEPLLFEGGCNSCKNCGYSKCD